MTTLYYSVNPPLWEQGESECRDIARLLEAMWRRSWQFAAHYPWVPKYQSARAMAARDFKSDYAARVSRRLR